MPEFVWHTPDGSFGVTWAPSSADLENEVHAETGYWPSDYYSDDIEDYDEYPEYYDDDDWEYGGTDD